METSKHHTFAFDYAIIGAGIIGLTIAHELKKKEPDSSIIIFEKEKELGLHASGRNSGVLHSGIYYNEDTLKAKFCHSGSLKMKDFALEHGIGYKASGKIIVASEDRDIPILNKLILNAKKNNINAELLTQKEINKIEPHAHTCEYGIYSPSTAVIDSKGVIKKLFEILKKQGVVFKFNSQIKNYYKNSSFLLVGDKKYSYDFLFNAAGSYADRVAQLFGIANEYTMIPFKGIYYKLSNKASHHVKSSIYPTPDINLPFLGVHLTRVFNNDVYIGPTAIPALGRENYKLLKGTSFSETSRIGLHLLKMFYSNNDNFRLLAVNELKKYLKPWFLDSVRRLVPKISKSDIIPTSKVGIRPQLVNINTMRIEMDFLLEETENSFHVLNSISPAFTSSFAIADWLVNDKLTKKLAL